MRREDEIFLAILRSVLWGGPAELPQDIDWQSVLNLAARQKCLHAFSVWLKAHRIATPFDKQLHTSMFMVLQRQVRLNYLATEVIELLAKHDIHATLIKGYSLSGLYPDPDMREFGDVDIYVGEANYHRAAELVTAAYPDAHWHSDIRGGIHFILVLDELQDRVVELHRVTMEVADTKANALYQAFTQKYLGSSSRVEGSSSRVEGSSVEWRGVKLPVPSAAYNALYVFMHAWHHFESTGVGLRQLGDWALCLSHAHAQSSPEEWQALVSEIDELLTALRMRKVWQTFGHILVRELGLPSKAFPLYTTQYQRLAKRLMRQLLRDGHGGRPATFQFNEIALMRCFPWERPAKNRALQMAYTFCRLLFEAWQMGKFFPGWAWHDWQATCKAKL
jgi:hypothetical protein